MSKFTVQIQVSLSSKPQIPLTLVKNKDEYDADCFYWPVIIIPAGHVHWHGASDSDAFSHLTIEKQDNEITIHKD